MRSHIIVATDFSPSSDRAMRRATMLAKQFDMTMCIVHVVDEDHSRHLTDDRAAAARLMLDESVSALARIDGIVAQARVVTGSVASGLLRVAEDVEPDLIVIGPHRKQFRDAFVGTTAERTIARGRHPVLIAAGVPSGPYGRALIALDMSEASKAAACRLADLPVLREAELVMMHAFDTPACGMMRRGMAAADAVHHYVASEERRADGEFRAMLNELALGSTRQVLRPINGQPARTILAAARDLKAPLVVVGTSQKKGFKRFILGSVAEGLLAGADRDILVIPRDGSSLGAIPSPYPDGVAQVGSMVRH